MANEGLNRVTLIGNLGQDPELRYTQSNQAVCSLRIACTETFFDSNTKEKKERTEWVTVVIWSKRGEALAKILTKGSRVCVEGRLNTRSWEDKNGGAKRYATDVVATNVVLLGGGQRNGDGASGGGDDYQSESESNYTPSPDDIPFLRNETTRGVRGDWVLSDKRII